MMKRTSVQKNIKIFLAAEIFVILTNAISYTFFLNAQVAFFSSFFILLGSMYSYKKLVEKRVVNEVFVDDERDELDEIDDKYELYDETHSQEQTIQEIKTVLKEEKEQMQSNNFKNVKNASGATVSFTRILGYLFLVAGFIGLQNNHNLELLPYLLFLSFGLGIGYLVGKELFSSK